MPRPRGLVGAHQRAHRQSEKGARLDEARAGERLYIIGYPEGGDTEYSVYDNHLVACKDHLIHYRTPTERGSSGSPAFGPTGWSVVALHHRGKDKMEPLHGESDPYEANEGISILAIQEASCRS
ncbi:MAG TPA: trypsin-like peptidase domain-containing protein [Pyrinomonadaceae bacterium]|nr:trypsin-like peptidase domain-containing protein [Pyrinomonadaceae bacterium]